MTGATAYRRKPKSFAADGETAPPADDSGWSEEDEELAKGAPLESLGPENNLAPGDRPWWQYQEVTNSPLVPKGDPEAISQVDKVEPPEAAKGVSSKGAPISDAVANGDTTPVPSQDTPEPTPKSSAWYRYLQGVQNAPVEQKAPWYRDLAARGLGFATGWVNAAGHLRNPINPTGAEEEIRHPGFAENQQVYESQMGPVRAQLGAEMGQREAQLKNEDVASQAALRQAQATQASGRGHWYEAQAGQKWRIDDKAGVIYNQDTREVHPLPPPTIDPVQRYQAILAATHDEALAKYEAFDKYKAPAQKQLTPRQQAESTLLDPNAAPDARSRAQNLIHPARQARATGAAPVTPDAAIKQAAADNPQLDYDAWTYMVDQKINVRGRGAAAEAEAQRIKARANQIMQEDHLTPADLFARRGEFKSTLPALAKVSTNAAMVDTFENTLERNAAIAQTLSDQFKRGDLRLYNRVASAFKTGTGDSEALNLAAQLHGIAREWGKIMSGSTGTQGVPISEANSTDEFFNKGISNGQLSSLIQNVIMPDARSRKAANEAERQALLGRIRGVAAPNAAPVSAVPQAATTDYTNTATGANGHKIGFKNGAWFDIQTGNRLQ